MTVLVVSLIAIAAILVGVKVYFQEKEKEALKRTETPEQTVYERLQEIAKSKEEIVIEKNPIVENVTVPKEEIKKKLNLKKSPASKNSKPKTKSKQTSK